VVAFAAGGVPVPREVRRLVADFAPDVMLVTPLVDPGSPQDDYVRCARELGVPSMLAVHSWDNLTLKGGIHTLPDRVAAWNEAQRREAVELHGVPAERVVVTGAVAYDHWFEWQPESDRAAFCRRFGLDPSRPYVLYLGSSEFIAPAEDAFVREWIASVRDAEPRLRDLQVLVRPHPLDSFDAADLPEGVVVHHSEGAEPLDDAMRRQYYDSIYHSAAVVGVLTSGLIEAAIVDRPVYVLLTERYHETQTGMFHFRHLLPENGGMLHVARNYREHAAQLREALLTQTTEGRNRRFVETFVRPFGLDEAASPRLVDASEALARAPVPAPARPHPGTAARGLARAGWFAMRTLQAFGLVQSTPRVRRADGVERGGRTPSIS
jgi:hypothetical protein